MFYIGEAITFFGIKINAYLGRLNQINLFYKTIWVFVFGQFSDICGRNHSFMPVITTALSSGTVTVV
jgi:hypothetical protein